jgi:hypothetical protein
MKGAAMRGDRRRARLPLLLFLPAAALFLGNCAHRAGGRATEGALAAARAPPPEGTQSIAERVGRDTTSAALATLSSPEGISSVATIVDATVTHSLEAALRAPAGAPGAQGRRGLAPGRSLVDRLAHDSATAFVAAFSTELESALGPDGQGPLAASVDAAVARASGSAVQGIRDQLADLFPGCTGEDRGKCVEAGVRSLGRAAAAGFVEGVIERLAWPLAILFVLLGVVLALAAQGAFGLARRRQPERREAHP